MSKIKITEAKCFEEVAKVIGCKNAERELFIASQSPTCNFKISNDLWSAFVWEETKQDAHFWGLICTGYNPYEVNYYD